MERQADFLEAARAELRGLLEITAPEAGTHVVAKLPRGVDGRVAARSAEFHGRRRVPSPTIISAALDQVI